MGSKTFKKLKKKKRIKKIRNQVEFIFMRGFTLLVWSGSLQTVLKVADWIGAFVFSVLRVRRQVVLKNLRDVFPEKSDCELKQIGKRTYQNFTKMVVDYIRFPVTDKKMIVSLCHIQGKENLDWALQNGKGAILVAGHFGSWELMGAALALMGYPIHFLVGKQRNRLVNEMMNKYREMMGIQIIQMGIAVRGVIKALRNNGMVALLADQDARRDGIFVDFFGRPASTHQGPAVFALKTGAPILFGSAIRLRGGRMRVECELLRFDHLQGLTPENIREVTEAWSLRLEKAIREHPDHWFWMHKRWKTKPPAEKNEKV